VAAIKAGQLGLKTACVEMRGSLGGTCLNVGCIPSKALLQSSHHYYDAVHHFEEHGIKIEGEIKMDVSKMLESKAKTVQGLTGGIEHLLKKHKVDYFKGKGMIGGTNSVNIALNDGGSQTLQTKNIVIATGSEVTPLPPVPVDNAGGKIVDSTGALDISEVPKTMAVIGGGVIGLEMGSVWSRLGAKVEGTYCIVCYIEYWILCRAVHCIDNAHVLVHNHIVRECFVLPTPHQILIPKTPYLSKQSLNSWIASVPQWTRKSPKNSRQPSRSRDSNSP